MTAIFLKILNMSITASWLILAVIMLRFLLQKAPKRINCVLWGVVALRLVMPFTFESAFSFIPSTDPIPQDIALSQTPTVDIGIPALNNLLNPIITESFAPEVCASVNPLQVVLFAASVIWLIGMAAILIYGIVSRVILHNKVRASLLYHKNVYYCDHIDTPFILGIIRPKIYIPSGISEEQMNYVTLHENAHLKRLDHWRKPIGFALLTVYWFHPLIWIAYILLCRDIEKACDEKVIRDMDNKAKKGYSEALVSCSIRRRKIFVCPLAFGEIGVKDRVKSVLNYKKPALGIIVVAVMACMAVTVCFLTDPKSDNTPLEPSENTVPDLTVICGTTAQTAWKGTYSWIYDMENGISSAVLADSSHPTAFLDYFEQHYILVADSNSTPPAATLAFDIAPDEISVNCWKIENGKYEKTTVDVDGTDVLLKTDGAYLYEVIAEWNDPDKNYRGTVDYGFCAKSDAPQ